MKEELQKERAEKLSHPSEEIITSSSRDRLELGSEIAKLKWKLSIAKESEEKVTSLTEEITWERSRLRQVAEVIREEYEKIENMLSLTYEGSEQKQ